MWWISSISHRQIIFNPWTVSKKEDWAIVFLLYAIMKSVTSDLFQRSHYGKEEQNSQREYWSRLSHITRILFTIGQTFAELCIFHLLIERVSPCLSLWLNRLAQPAGSPGWMEGFTDILIQKDTICKPVRAWLADSIFLLTKSTILTILILTCSFLPSCISAHQPSVFNSSFWERLHSCSKKSLLDLISDHSVLRAHRNKDTWRLFLFQGISVKLCSKNCSWSKIFKL